jgi:hypothetical protein
MLGLAAWAGSLCAVARASMLHQAILPTLRVWSSTVGMLAHVPVDHGKEI